MGNATVSRVAGGLKWGLGSWPRGAGEVAGRTGQRPTDGPGADTCTPRLAQNVKTFKPQRKGAKDAKERREFLNEGRSAARSQVCRESRQFLRSATVWPCAIPSTGSVPVSFALFLALLCGLCVNALNAGQGPADTHPVSHGIFSHPLLILLQRFAHEVIGIRIGGIQVLRFPDRGLETDQHPELRLDPGRRKQSVLRIAFTHSAQCGQV